MEIHTVLGRQQRYLMRPAYATCLCTIAIMVLACVPSRATCSETSFELKHDDKKKNVETILDYGNCVKQGQKARVGKWFCFISRMVGIQTDDQNKVTSGNIEPKNSKFFITIAEEDDNQKKIACGWGEFGLSFNLNGRSGNRCLANYSITFSPDMGTFNDSPDSYYFHGDTDTFTLYETNDFIFFRIVGGSSYVSHGRCEKIN
jgi:hypothetical protein